MEHIHNQAALHGVEKFWTTGAKKGPPTVRDVPKNKLDELKNWNLAPQPFCLDLLPGHLWKTEVWPFLQDTVAFWSLCVTNTYMLTWTIHHILRTTRFEPWDRIHWRLRRLISQLVHNPRQFPIHWALPPDSCHHSAPLTGKHDSSFHITATHCVHAAATLADACRCLSQKVPVY